MTHDVCHMVKKKYIYILIKILDKLVKLLGGGSFISGAHLVWFIKKNIYINYNIIFITGTGTGRKTSKESQNGAKRKYHWL